MNSDDLKVRTKMFALQGIQLTENLPRSRAGEVLGKQLMRAATSVGANYRAACRARSKADFISKITIVEEESDESQYWLELMSASRLGDQKKIAELFQESRELTAIFTA